MAITYPLSLPTSIGIAEITLTHSNAVAVSRSPFTYKQQIFQHPGQRWSASVVIPSVGRDKAEPWISFLMALNGPVGTFLLGDPNATEPRGTANQVAITGSAGSSSPTVTMSGQSLLAGDYIQVGTGSDARLYKVLVDKTGTGTLEIWPSLRVDASSEPVIVSDTKGLFRLSGNQQGYRIDGSDSYSISFDCVEAI